MGACTTKLKGVDLESDMPPPMEDSTVSSERKIEEETKVEDAKERRSLSNLFQENQEVKESSEKEPETQMESDIPRQEQPNTEYPALTVQPEEAPVAAQVEEPVVAVEESKKEETNTGVVVAEKVESPLRVFTTATTEVGFQVVA